jgi:hypothetical protein
MRLDQIEKRASEALEFLTDTDERAAALKFEVERSLLLYNKTVDAHFLVSEGPVEVRKAKARQEAEPLYIDYLESVRKFDEVDNKRRSETKVLDWLRSLNANVRQGA